jgi:pimeloyl-ACP methyl ester carboxylesterase
MNIRLLENVSIPIGPIELEGTLSIPARSKSIVIFSHGSGSSRFSRRNQAVAEFLGQKNIGTLLFDLLTPAEDRDYHNRFNIDLLADRLAGATEWILQLPEAKHCHLGYFGASTGAASALIAAAKLPSIEAIVSRGGRPDLAMDVLHKVKAPTLLIVGSLDIDVLRMNQQAYQQLNCQKRLEIVDGATHLFEEPGKMEEVATLAADWFQLYLVKTMIHS